MIEIFLFQNVPDVGLGVEKIDDGPVSYTHLDVYKRQVQN